MWTRIGDPEAPPASQGWEPGWEPGLVGRERETAELRELLAGRRVVTVTGAAGVGKSRLAATVVAAAGDGPWRHLVPVRWHGSGAGGHGSLAGAVAAALDGTRHGREPADAETVAAELPSGALLFLDDVDPVHGECVGLVQRLLMTVPDVRVLVTSRRALGLGDEHVLRLAPLATESPRADGRTAPAVELFVERARAVAPGTCADEAELAAAARVCGLLEGVPLAVELAAAQTVCRPVGELAALLERDQGWLNSPRPVLRRHRSLREAVGASYVLCDREERIVWARASILPGAFAEGTGGFVCGGNGVAPREVPACLAQLAACGVLEPLGDPGGVHEPRYRMTRAARDFGLERLREAGEFPVAAERRKSHCRRMAAVIENLWHTGNQDQAVRFLLGEHDNLTATVRHAAEEPEHVEAALEIVVGLWFWWAVHDRAEEGRELLLRLLPLCPEGSRPTARALWLTAWLSAASDPAAARALLGRAWPAAVLAGDDAAVGRIAYVEGVLALHRDDPRAAAGHFQEAAATIPDHALGGPSPAVGEAAAALAQADFAPAAARASARRALARAGVRDDAWTTLVARYARAEADRRLGRTARAWRRARRALDSLDPVLPVPRGHGALRRLLADLETGAPVRPAAARHALADPRPPDGREPHTVPRKNEPALEELLDGPAERL
ncbi:hypothetical protein GCM10009801_67650 [Streptomyces albiaxialis]|uniref:AAA+ ATPase domain-containing protein n=1 Tax=Streptomyces albiaxialis TaxID=329523 RepID=A0ABN2WR03_9ACTN